MNELDAIKCEHAALDPPNLAGLDALFARALAVRRRLEGDALAPEALRACAAQLVDALRSERHDLERAIVRRHRAEGVSALRRAERRTA